MPSIIRVIPLIIRTLSAVRPDVKGSTTPMVRRSGDTIDHKGDTDDDKGNTFDHKGDMIPLIIRTLSAARPDVKGSTTPMVRRSAGAHHAPPPGLRASVCCTTSWFTTHPTHPSEWTNQMREEGIYPQGGLIR
eukprot:1191282-Prorocentrum_minimum.AAC.1